MPIKKQNFPYALVALAFSASAANAAPVPVFDLPAAPLEQTVLAQPELTATLPLPSASDDVDVAEVAAPTLIPEPSNWTMLMVGAGVLLLPRRRPLDNSVR